MSFILLVSNLHDIDKLQYFITLNMQRHPKSLKLGSSIKKGVKIIFVAEFFAFCGAYFVWARMNRNQREYFY